MPSSVYGENPFLEVPAQSRLDICRCNIKQSAKATAFYEDLMSKPSSTIWMDIHSIYYIKYIFSRFSEFLFKVHASLCVPRWQADRMWIPACGSEHTQDNVLDPASSDHTHKSAIVFRHLSTANGRMGLSGDEEQEVTHSCLFLPKGLTLLQTTASVATGPLILSDSPPPELGCPHRTSSGGLGHSKHQETSRTFPSRPRECTGILVTTSPQPGSPYQIPSSPADPLSSVWCLTAPPGQQGPTSESN